MEKLKHAAACAIELQRRLRWRRFPEQWFAERLGINLWDKQLEIVRSVRDNRKTHVRSGHKVGKTICAAGLALWFLDCWRPSKVITTSASWSDVRIKLWGHIRKLYRSGGMWFGQEPNEVDLRVSDDHYMIGLSPKEVEPFQGHNAEHVLVIFDEASSFDEEFFDAADAQATRMLAIGNPLLASGPFFRFAKSKEWHHIHISCLDHPNIVQKSQVIAGGPSLEWIESRKENWGETSPLFLTRVAGEFPEESIDTLFPLTVIRQSFAKFEKVRNWELTGVPSRIGFDVARAGGDKTVSYRNDEVKCDDEVARKVVMELMLNKTEHHATRMKAISLWQIKPIEFCNMDAGGEGSGLADELIAADFPVNRIMFGASPVKKDYFDIRAEMYWDLSKAMKGGLAVQGNNELEEELSVIGGMASLKEKSVDGTKRVVFWLPPKDKVKEKLGRSPDKADALALSNYNPQSPWGAVDYFNLEKSVEPAGVDSFIHLI